jgi:hypothetical protein
MPRVEVVVYRAPDDKGTLATTATVFLDGEPVEVEQTVVDPARRPLLGEFETDRDRAIDAASPAAGKQLAEFGEHAIDSGYVVGSKRGESTYGWICDVDHHQMEGVHDYTGCTGPRNIPDALLRRLEAGEGRGWRTLYDLERDDDRPLSERIVHSGRYLDWSDLDPDRDDERTGHPEVEADAEFGPLTDLSKPDSGAAEIEYRHAGDRWVAL